MQPRRTQHGSRPPNPVPATVCDLWVARLISVPPPPSPDFASFPHNRGKVPWYLRLTFWAYRIPEERQRWDLWFSQLNTREQKFYKVVKMGNFSVEELIAMSDDELNKAFARILAGRHPRPKIKN